MKASKLYEVMYCVLRVLMIIIFCEEVHASSVLPSRVEVFSEELPDCNNVCDGEWGRWTNWNKCTDGECHLKHGKRTRQTYCYVMVKLPPSRADGGSREVPAVSETWKDACRQVQKQKCVQEMTCTGNWAGWSSWTQCHNDSQNECVHDRRRVCVDPAGKRLPGSHCYGGHSNDTEVGVCNSRKCSVKSRISADYGDLEGKWPIRTLETNNEKKESTISHSTVLIIAVAVGSVVFGAIFVLIIINVVRRTAGRDDGSNSRDRWKRMGSTTTSSIGYSAGYLPASEVLSPRSELRDLQSPGSSTTGSGSSAASQLQFFSRSGTVSPIQTDLSASQSLLTVSGSVAPTEERPRRSLLQENIYWEIKENQVTGGALSSENSTEGTESPASTDREVVQNVLYGSTV